MERGKVKGIERIERGKVKGIERGKVKGMVENGER